MEKSGADVCERAFSSEDHFVHFLHLPQSVFL